MASKPKNKEMKKGMVEKKRKRQKQTKDNNNNKNNKKRDPFWKERGGWIHAIRVQYTNHLAVTIPLQGNRRSQTTKHKERMSGLIKHWDYPPHSYIVNEQYNSIEKQKGKPREKNNNSEWQEPVTSPTPKT